MSYVFDTNSFREIFRYPKSRFPSLWEKFDDLIENNKITSVREVFEEIEDIESKGGPLIIWAKEHEGLFTIATPEEAKKVIKIFETKHYEGLIDKKKRLKGGPVADPFLIAKAAVEGTTVVTEEKYKKNSNKIPNVCEKFNVNCSNLEGFMKQENWVF